MNKLFILIGCAALLYGCSEQPRCNDGIQNGDETEVDCGGTCPECYTCDDGFQNQDEVGIDCGGPCGRCPDQWDGWATNQHLEYVRFTDPEHAFAFTYPYLYRTTDGGHTWSQLNTSLFSNIFQIMPVTADKCFMHALVGTEYWLYVTQDGGNTWQKCILDNVPSYTQDINVNFYNAQRGVMTLHAYYELSAYFTMDGGKTWINTLKITPSQPPPQLPANAELSIGDLSTFASGKAIAMGYQLRLVSSNFGQTWTLEANAQAGIRTPNSIHWQNESIGYMEGVSTAPGSINVQSFKTTDGGNNWTVYANVPDQYDTNSMPTDPSFVIPLNHDTLFHGYASPLWQGIPTAHPGSLAAFFSSVWVKSPDGAISPFGKMARNTGSGLTFQVFPNAIIGYNSGAIFRLNF